MSQFKMTWPTSRVFPALGEVEPDAVVESDANPDPAFFEAVKPATPTYSAPVAEGV